MQALVLVIWVYATQLVAGSCVVRALGYRGSRTGAVARALLLGPAAIAAQCFVYDLVSIPWTLPLVLGPWWLAGAFVALRYGRARLARRTSRAEAAALGFFGLVFLLELVFGLCLPVMDLDAVANFAMFGKIFAAHGGFAPEALRSIGYIGHPEYPPLVAINESLGFRAAHPGGEYAIRVFFSLAWLALAFLTLEACERHLARAPAVIVAVFVMATPFVWEFGENGYAELRLIATLLLVVLEARVWVAQRDRRSAMAVAAAAAACALTKNEGLMMAGFCLVFLVLVLVRTKTGWRATWPALAVIGVAALAWPIWKQANAISEPFLSQAAERGLDFARVPEIVRFFLAEPFAEHLAGTWRWGFVWPVAVAALLFCAFKKNPSVLPFVAGFGVQMGIYTLVFVATPHPLDWHLATAAPRLLMHTLPWLIFVLAIGTGSLDPRLRNA